MHILQFFPKHLFTLDKLRVASLFPELIMGISFMGFLEKCQKIQDPCCLALFQIPQNFFGSEGLEIMELLGQIASLQNAVHVIFQNHIPIDLHTPVLLPPGQGIEDDQDCAGPGEDGKPVEHGEGQEMRRADIGYDVTATAYDAAP
jgi:hypothetical protein